VFVAIPRFVGDDAATNLLFRAKREILPFAYSD
jgi:hypothetical protein